LRVKHTTAMAGGHHCIVGKFLNALKQAYFIKCTGVATTAKTKSLFFQLGMDEFFDVDLGIDKICQNKKTFITAGNQI